MALDKSKCRDCQFSGIEYTTDPAGKPVRHGFCRSCFEQRAYRAQGKGGGGSGRFRSADARENTEETKHGTGHG